MNSLEVKKYPRGLRKLAYPVLAGYLAAVIFVGALFAVPGFHSWMIAHLTWIVVVCHLPFVAYGWALMPDDALIEWDATSLSFGKDVKIDLTRARFYLVPWVSHGVRLGVAVVLEEGSRSFAFAGSVCSTALRYMGEGLDHYAPVTVQESRLDTYNLVDAPTDDVDSYTTDEAGFASFIASIQQLIALKSTHLKPVQKAHTPENATLTGEPYIVGGPFRGFDFVCAVVGTLMLLSIVAMALIDLDGVGEWMPVLQVSLLICLYGWFSIRHIFWWREFDPSRKTATFRLRVGPWTHVISVVDLSRYEQIGYTTTTQSKYDEYNPEFSGSSSELSQLELSGNGCKPFLFSVGRLGDGSGSKLETDPHQALENLSQLLGIKNVYRVRHVPWWRFG